MDTPSVPEPAKKRRVRRTESATATAAGSPPTSPPDTTTTPPPSPEAGTTETTPPMSPPSPGTTTPPAPSPEAEASKATAEGVDTPPITEPVVTPETPPKVFLWKFLVISMGVIMSVLLVVSLFHAEWFRTLKDEMNHPQRASEVNIAALRGLRESSEERYVSLAKELDELKRKVSKLSTFEEDIKAIRDSIAAVSGKIAVLERKSSQVTPEIDIEARDKKIAVLETRLKNLEERRVESTANIATPIVPPTSPVTLETRSTPPGTESVKRNLVWTDPDGTRWSGTELAVNVPSKEFSAKKLAERHVVWERKIDPEAIAKVYLKRRGPSNERLFEEKKLSSLTKEYLANAESVVFIATAFSENNMVWEK